MAEHCSGCGKSSEMLISLREPDKEPTPPLCEKCIRERIAELVVRVEQARREHRNMQRTKVEE